MKNYTLMSSEQSRQAIDVAQAFRSWRDAACQTWNGQGGRYVAQMSWRTGLNGRQYLVERARGYRKHHGPRSTDTEQQYESYTQERMRIIDRMKTTHARLQTMAPVNRALRLGRMPRLTAEILRQFDHHGFLGTRIVIVGTNALYAYEAKAGVHISSPLMETRDADLLWDAREKLTLTIGRMPPPAVLALLRKADPSFDASRQYGLSAENKDGFIVELLTVDTGNLEVTGLPDDLTVNPMVGMDALLALPRLEAIVIDQRGMPVRVVAPEVRTFTLLKEWVSRQSSRPPEKRRRDRDQAAVLREIVVKELGLGFDAELMRQVPAYLTAL